MLRYKLIASDFDGTLRRSDGTVSEETKRVVNEFISRGGIFAICTGRMTLSILPHARALGLKGLLVAYQGGVIRDIESGAFLRDLRIPNADAVMLCEFLEKDGYHVHAYDGDRFFVNADDGFRSMYEQICRVHGILTPQNISETVKREGFGANKIVVMCESSKHDGLLSRCLAAFGDRFYITSSMDQMVEIAPKGADKGGALEFLARHYAVPVAETIGVGDNFNDLPLIQRAGLGVAIGNAVEELKAAAGFTTKSCDEDGVAYVIRKFALGEEE